MPGTIPSIGRSNEVNDAGLRCTMNQKLLFPVLFVVLSSTGCASINSSLRPDLWGDPTPVSPGARTIVIKPDTQYVNVAGGETINFIVGAKSFAWAFDGPSEGYTFDLKKAAPPGVLDHSVIAYVDADPKYMGGR